MKSEVYEILDEALWLVTLRTHLTTAVVELRDTRSKHPDRMALDGRALPPRRRADDPEGDPGS